jgi:signal transduction histidine kinase
MAAERLPLRRRGTVRTRTTVAATLIFGLTFLLGGAAMVTLLRQSLIRDLDGVADIRADDIAALARRGALPDTLLLEDDAVGQVVDAQGRVLAASANVRGEAPIATLRPRGVDPVFSTVDALPGMSGDYRLLALRSDSPDGPVTVYVGTSLEPTRDTLVLVGVGLLVGAPLLLALVAALTWVSVGRALRPVDAIRSQVADLSSRDLHRRVPVPPTDDEIGRLAVTMNAMLSRLQDAADKQRRFVADASHELQSPLAASRLDLEVTLAHPDAANWLDTARDLLAENRRMDRLVADLLFIARADDGAPLAPCTPVDLHEVVFDEAARLDSTTGIRIDTSGVTSTFVQGRRDDLSRAVRNLLDNAERHATSAVTVGLHNGDGVVTLVVEDDGPGVPPADRARIFERFTRLDDARTRSHDDNGQGHGTGLGLAIVKEIIEHHGGHVTAEGPTDTAGGARFVVTLPPD